MTTRGRPSVFVALNKLRVTEDFDSDDNSAEERQEERKEKQKLKKKARTKKKNSSTQLKDLAFVSVSKPKKNKSKKSKTQSQSSAAVPSEETPTINGDGDDRQEAESLANVIKATPQPQKTPVAVNDSDTKPQSVIRHETVAQPQKQQQQKKKAASTPNEPQQQTAAPPPASIASPPALSFPQSSSETELGAIYTPAHITITRVDGQIKRTVAVTEVMDQLLRYTQQNSQLLTLQEQLGHANRSLQDQLQRSAEIITSLQNEVTMFRQMCLNLQAEVSLLRSNVIPDVGSPLQLQHRPPPGMS